MKGKVKLKTDTRHIMYIYSLYSKQSCWKEASTIVLERHYLTLFFFYWRQGFKYWLITICCKYCIEFWDIRYDINPIMLVQYWWYDMPNIVGFGKINHQLIQIKLVHRWGNSIYKSKHEGTFEQALHIQGRFTIVSDFEPAERNGLPNSWPR